MVFELLAGESIRFHAVIRDKRGLAADVRNKNRQSASYHYHPNALYDQMVTRLFKNLLHTNAAYRVNFACRGARDRTQALQAALERARENFRQRWGIECSAPIEVASMNSTESAGLQAVDYFLWALQRVYTKDEDRFLKAVWEKVAVVHDVDDRRKSPTGVYYTKDRPLVSECIKKNARDIGTTDESATHTAWSRISSTDHLIIPVRRGCRRAGTKKIATDRLCSRK